MILRKPYAFLIKHFKLLHMILVLPMIYLLFKTNMLLEFINEYNASPSVIIDGEFNTALFTAPMFFLNFLIILIAVILIAVMYNKKKPFIYYIFTVVVYLSLFVLYIFTYSIVGQMQNIIVDSRLSRAIGDILLIAYLIQLFNVVQTAIRATGFDIKKFNFGEDLQELNISSEDNEEFEFEMKINTTQITNELKKSLRFMKYVYIENKFILDCIGLAVVCVITYFIYINIAANNRFYAQDTYFNAGRINIMIDDAYITDRNYNGEKVGGDSIYVVVRANLKNLYRDDEKLNTGLFQLAIGDNVYYHSAKTKSYFTDMGNVYNNFNVPMSETEYLFVYEIPYEQRHEKMYFRYLNNDSAKSQLHSRYLKVRLDVEDLTVFKNGTLVKFGKDIVFDNSLLLKTSLNISSIDIGEKFDAKYEFCAEKDLCYDSVEIVRPNINTNYDKALLRIKGTLKLDKGVATEGVDTIYSFLNKFGTIEYVVDGKPFVENISSRIATRKFTSKNTIYVETNKRILEASEVVLKITIRNETYIYKIK